MSQVMIGDHINSKILTTPLSVVPETSRTEIRIVEI